MLNTKYQIPSNRFQTLIHRTLQIEPQMLYVGSQNWTPDIGNRTVALKHWKLDSIPKATRDAVKQGLWTKKERDLILFEMNLGGD